MDIETVENISTNSSVISTEPAHADIVLIKFTDHIQIPRSPGGILLITGVEIEHA